MFQTKGTTAGASIRHDPCSLLPKACDAITFWGGIGSCRELRGFYFSFLNSTHLWGDVSREELGFAIQPVKRKGKKCKSYQEGLKCTRACRARGCSGAKGKAPVAHGEGELPSPDEI